MAKKARPTKQDALDRFAQSEPLRVLSLVLWKIRHEQEEMTVLIREEDIAGFDQCMEYQRAQPQVLVYRPPAIPATPGSPAVGNRRAVPARPAEPARPFVIVSLVEKGTRNAIKPIENNEQDYELGERRRQVQVVKRNLPDYAAALRRTAATGDFSAGTFEEIARALDLWSRT